jgi:SAM-dependent methyltransferase
VELETIDAASLDFIFSNHVFEHLANPLQVMINWLGRLKPGGVILGVTPDPRFTFDCRQQPTTMSEVLAEEAAGGHIIPRAKYERWCRLTEPRHTPDGLIKRGYSIHVNYFTPEGFQAMLDVLKGRGLISRTFLAAAPNNKDFAFALWKAAGAGEACAAAWQRGSAVA